LSSKNRKVALGSRSNGSLVDVVLKNGLVLTENLITQRTQFNVAGTTEQLYQDDNYLDLLERIKMKYTMPFIKLDPVMELGLCVAQTAMVMHAQNKFKDSLQLDPDINLDASINESVLENEIIEQ
jgi:hypothetical protein